MTEGPIDLNRARKDQERLTDIRNHLQATYVRIMDAQSKLMLRMEDLTKDSTDLALMLTAEMEQLWEKYPELMPELLDEEDLEE